MDWQKGTSTVSAGNLISMFQNMSAKKDEQSPSQATTPVKPKQQAPSQPATPAPAKSSSDSDSASNNDSTPMRPRGFSTAYIPPSQRPKPTASSTASTPKPKPAAITISHTPSQQKPAITSPKPDISSLKTRTPATATATTAQTSTTPAPRPGSLAARMQLFGVTADASSTDATPKKGSTATPSSTPARRGFSTAFVGNSSSTQATPVKKAATTATTPASPAKAPQQAVSTASTSTPTRAPTTATPSKAPTSVSTSTSSASGLKTPSKFSTAAFNSPQKVTPATPSAQTVTPTATPRKRWEPPKLSTDAASTLPKHVFVATPVKAPASEGRMRSATLVKKTTTNSNSNRCAVCDKAVYAMEKVVADGIVLHKTCFRCAECNMKVSTGSYASLDGVIYCKPHFKQLFQLKGRYTFNSESL